QGKEEFPKWFQDPLDKLLGELKYDLENLGHSRYYAAGTFWVPRKATWFSLGGSNVKPTDLFAPDFFLWDPLSLLGKNFRLSCPECAHYLTRGGVVSRPRRVVDIDSCFWLIGYTYACQKTNSGGCGACFRSWDQRILKRLSPSLAGEFPAHLTWCSGLSTRAFGVVRSCFQHGMGAEEVADLFRMQHLRRYDELHLRYLRTKVKQAGFPGQTYEPFLPFQDRSSAGFRGFTPSGQWLRDVYDTFIESHRDSINQHTAMLSARIGAIDHSHKLAKHVFKVDGVPIFTALLTVTNEKGEIRVCVFVATKSHSQYEDALRRLADDLTVYGHDLPEVFYTDNIADKAMLEKLFVSLREGVVSVEKHSHLPILSTPAFVSKPDVLESTVVIDNVMRSILSDAQSGNHIVVGFDSEWNIDVAPMGRLLGRGPPAVIQIAYKDRVYILQIGEMLKDKKLPPELVNILRESRVIKAGRQVNGDLRQLAVAAGHPADFFRELSAPQLLYAARDAYASLLLYHEINKTPLPLPMPNDIAAGTPVLLLTDDNKKLAARGVVSPASFLNTFNGTNITSTRTVITVHEILIPGAIIGQNNKKRALGDLGDTPFDVLAHRSHVRVTPRDTVLAAPMASTLHTENETDTTGCVAQEVAVVEDINMVSAADSLDAVDTDDGELGTEPGPTSFEKDQASEVEGQTILGPAVIYTFAWLIRSRVLKDIFHVFNMIYISRSHGLRIAFSRALRDALLIPHPSDKAWIERYLKTRGVTWDNMLRFHPTWVWRHCRRTIPPPEVLYPLVHEVFMTYGPLKDAKTGLPLFNSAAWRISKNILELIQNGYVSDPPGVQLYYCLGFDAKADGLPIYRCVRGTNMVEGGVHTHLLSKLPSRGASVRHMICCLLDFVLRHNLHVGHFNSTGKKYIGHDSIWLVNDIQELEITLGERYKKPPLELAWVNGNLYQKTQQTIGIIKIPQTICAPVKIQPYNEEADSKQKQAYLAKMQGTRKPVLPVHTLAEKMLFNKLMRTSPAFQNCKTAISAAAAEIWNREAEKEQDVYYKLDEQLTAYLNGAYKDSANIRQSCSQARDKTANLEHRLRDPHRS
ncbi:hypothetical protein C8R45DRAFT_776206, partial [Mycena sanguinolenta]